MKIIIRGGKFETSSLFKLIIVGYTFGVSFVFLAFMPMVVLASLFSGEPEEIWKSLLAIPIIPITAFLQALMISLAIVFGLYAYNKIKGIEIVTEEKRSNPRINRMEQG